jgi:chemotaxis protein MotB
VNDKSIRIEGHTGPLTQRYPANWELSAARAINVARYLQKQGIEPIKLSAAAFSEFKSVADNSTLEGRAKMRGRWTRRTGSTPHRERGFS